MLPRSTRVSSTLFSSIIATGTTMHGGALYLRLLKQDPSTPSRFSVVVPKKIEKKATRRNTIRRKGYAALASFRKELHPGFAGVFFAKAGIQELGVEALKLDIRQLLTQAKVLSR